MKKKIITLAAALTLAASGFGQILLTEGVAYTQGFDSIGTSSTAALPIGWGAQKLTGANGITFAFGSTVTATEQIGGNSMSSTAANGIYNFGAGVAASATDRAIGFLSSGAATQTGALIAQFQVASPNPVSTFTISYDVEKYRTGTNAAGFSIQMFYSTTGLSGSWQSAGASFLTSFGADAATAGYASAPGATSSVTATHLELGSPIASGSQLYLAWRYSVTSGTTTTNAQALGIDNFSVTAIPEPSTYALIMGVLTFGFIVWRRRQKS